MNRFAIDILDAARESAEPAPIKPGPAVRLALAWLSINGIADAEQIECFWTSITKPPRDLGMGPYCRRRDTHICIDRWRALSAKR